LQFIGFNGAVIFAPAMLSQNDTLIGPLRKPPDVKMGNDTIITGAIYYQNEWMLIRNRNGGFRT
jgi:hypothetical protein